MNAVAQVLAVVEGLVLIAVGMLEAFQYRNPRWYRMFLIDPRDYAAVRLWTVNVGFYNAVMGVGLLVGVVLLWVGDPVVGRTLVYFICAAHVVLGAVLAISEPRLRSSAILQSGLPLLVIVVGFAF